MSDLDELAGAVHPDYQPAPHHTEGYTVPVGYPAPQRTEPTYQQPQYQTPAVRRPYREPLPAYSLLSISAWVIVSAGLLLIAFAVFSLLYSLAKGANEVASARSEFERSLAGIGMTAGVITAMVEFVGGCWSVLFGAIGLAVRDLTRNSWRR